MSAIGRSSGRRRCEQGHIRERRPVNNQGNPACPHSSGGALLRRNQRQYGGTFNIARRGEGNIFNHAFKRALASRDIVIRRAQKSLMARSLAACSMSKKLANINGRRRLDSATLSLSFAPCRGSPYGAQSCASRLASLSTIEKRPSFWPMKTNARRYQQH